MRTKETQKRNAEIINQLKTRGLSMLIFTGDKYSVTKKLVEKLGIDIEFKEGILKINAQFQNYFALMFGGGNASLNVFSG